MELTVIFLKIGTFYKKKSFLAKIHAKKDVIILHYWMKGIDAFNFERFSASPPPDTFFVSDKGIIARGL